MSDGQKLRQADEKFCFSCGRVLHISAPACPSCGASQAPQALESSALVVAEQRSVVAHRPSLGQVTGLQVGQSMFCYGCGTQIHAAALACPACGAVQIPAASRGAKDRTTAIALAFLLGGLGAHRFYLGNVGLGFLYLLFSWTLIPALIAMIEGIIFISSSDADFHRKYG